MRLIYFQLLLFLSLTHSQSYADIINYTDGFMDIKIENVTETSAHVTWTKNESHKNILQYGLIASVIHTYSSNHTLYYPKRWTFSNNTLRSEIADLLPCTKFNITVKAVFSNSPAIEVYKTFETLLADPDQDPPDPEIISRSGSTMVIKLFPVQNNHGPVSFYRIIVLNVDEFIVFQPNSIHPYEQARDEGFAYYISAEINAKDVNREFTVGDGNRYNGFYNAPLEKNTEYLVFVGVGSTLYGRTRIRYPTSITERSLLIVHQSEEDSSLIIGLSIAVVFASLCLIAGIVILVIVRRRYQRNRRQRLSDNQELSIRGSMVEVANQGYLSDEDMVNHYDALKDKVWNIPRDLLQVHSTANGDSFLGFGKFGHVVKGTVTKKYDNIPIEVACYLVTDGDLNQEKKRTMLRQFDILVKAETHENVASLIGTHESPETVFIVVEHSSLILKDMLLNSRHASQSKCTSMSEMEVLNLLIGIADGMNYLSQRNIFHERLCAKNIFICDGQLPKITGHGLSHYNRSNYALDFTRWTAQEVLNSKKFNSKSDVWSYGCLMWETCCLGGTPYNQLEGKQVAHEVCRGLRLKKLPTIGEEFYQFILRCWQCDPDERPTFYEITQQHYYFKETLLMYAHINFDISDNFNYEPFLPQLEVIEEYVTQSNIR